MAVDSAQSLSATSLVIYILTLPPINCVLIKHGKHGFLGWFFLSAFATLQIIAGGFNVNGKPELAGSIVSTVGLSPLLLAAQGVLHEAQLKVSTHAKRDLFVCINIHFLVGTGVALNAVGAAGALSAPEPSDPHDPTSVAATEDKFISNLTLWKTGAALLAVAWALITTLTIMTIVNLPSARSKNAMGTHNCTASRNTGILSYSVLAALPFIAVRTFYGLAYAVSQSPSLSSATGATWVRVVLQFLPMLAACWIMIAGGFITRSISNAELSKRMPMDTVVEWK